jgi:glycosyltransferase involved in cell wall biosynthesis
LHRTILKSYQKNIDLFIAPSKFVRQKLVESGFSEDRVVHLSHFCDSSKYVPSYESDNYLVFFGRVDHRKGLLTLIKAVERLPTKLVIVGDGPEKRSLERYIAAKAVSNVSLVGYKSGEELQSIIRRARFCVLPSESNETFGHTILESFACGKPVIASRIGAIPELIKENENGHLFMPGNVEELTSRISFYIANPGKVKEMGKVARFIVKRDYSPEDHYEKLIVIYRDLAS